MYIVSAANPMSNDPNRYTYHGRAFMVRQRTLCLNQFECTFLTATNIG